MAVRASVARVRPAGRGCGYRALRRAARPSRDTLRSPLDRRGHRRGPEKALQTAQGGLDRTPATGRPLPGRGAAAYAALRGGRRTLDLGRPWAPRQQRASREGPDELPAGSTGILAPRRNRRTWQEFLAPTPQRRHLRPDAAL